MGNYFYWKNMYLPIQAETYNLSFGTDLKVSPTVGTLSKIPRVKIKKKIPALTFLSKWLGKINPVIQPPKKKKKMYSMMGMGMGIGIGIGMGRYIRMSRCRRGEIFKVVWYYNLCKRISQNNTFHLFICYKFWLFSKLHNLVRLIYVLYN